MQQCTFNRQLASQIAVLSSTYCLGGFYTDFEGWNIFLGVCKYDATLIWLVQGQIKTMGSIQEIREILYWFLSQEQNLDLDLDLDYIFEDRRNALLRLDWPVSNVQMYVTDFQRPPPLHVTKTESLSIPGASFIEAASVNYEDSPENEHLQVLFTSIHISRRLEDSQ
ncbi:uncharacterized protein PAC_09128 [Phialocephala subalpina]|uniref:Uncharacterized protein n=1 Tax=Phialocephala subalpina TaxID=576137 RepID=A0A1L7X2I7_9HELO|nr:uncharacterized protein PAC_09128 [Phialocephala subalpina]